MQKPNKEFILYIIGILIAFAVIIIGLFLNYGKQIIPESLTRILSSFLLSIFVILVTDKLSLRARDSNLDKFHTKIQNHINTFPRSNLITEFHSSDEAMEYLCQRIPFATTIFNTRISKYNVRPKSQLDDRYSSTIKKGLKSGLSYKEIISPGFQERSVELNGYAKNSSEGTYFFSVADFEAPSFMNFTILEYKSGEKELIFGWATSILNGTENKAYKIVDTRVISYYLSFWYSLFPPSK
ncbi:MAG: hypothetical protein K8S62_11875 [Candidatus Sabulitectum sp.]|nr:hypothetical protein [Candidatus Sabulitectum sp.]